MTIGGVHLGRPDAADRARLLRHALDAAPTYDHVGSTLDPQRWAGPDVRSAYIDVGHGPAAFDAARLALQTWVPQRAIGATVTPREQAVVVDGTVLLVLQRGPLWMAAPDRIVAVVDEPGRFAYAYGTLPGHPERGEEGFSVERLADDTVRATIRVQAGPATLVGRALAPIVSRLQAAALDRYLAAIAGSVAQAARRPGRT